MCECCVSCADALFQLYQAPNYKSVWQQFMVIILFPPFFLLVFGACGQGGTTLIPFATILLGSFFEAVRAQLCNMFPGTYPHAY